MTRYRFDQIAENSTAKKKPEESDRDRYVGLEHLDPGTLEVTRWGAEVTPKGDKLLMKKGDVLFGRRRAYQKKVGIAPFDGIFSAHGMVLRPKADVVDPMFFPFFISSDIFLDEAIRVSVGSLSPTANWKDLRTLEFDLPSPGKQRELAGILSEAESLKGHYRKMLTTCDDVVKSQFVEMFGRLNSTDLKPLKDVCSIITDGTHQPPKFVDRGIPFLFVSNITSDTVNYDTNKFISVEDYEQLIRRTPIEVGDVLVSAVGSFGHPAIVEDDRPFCFQRHIAYLKPRHDLIDSNYLHAALLSEDAQRYMDRCAKGAAQRTVTLKSFKEMKVPVPPFSLQQEFADFVAQVDKSKFAVQKALDELNATTKKILNQELGLGDV